MSHQKVTTRNALGFSKVAANCSIAGIYKTCKCKISKLRDKEHRQKYRSLKCFFLYAQAGF